jgi:hypothetical protein
MLGWGLAFGSLFWLFARFMEPATISTKFTLTLLGVSLVSGAIFGAYLWNRLENQHRKSGGQTEA